MRARYCPLLLQALLYCLSVMAISCQETPVNRAQEPQPAAKMQQSSLSQPGLIKSEFIFETAPFPECHASTIAETKSGLVTAWFGGTGERHPDVGIWLSRQSGGRWSAPVEVANGVQSPTNRYACWNPVLFQPRNGPLLLLFYKVGPSPSSWWGM